MKTTIVTIAIALSTVFGTTKTTFAATTNQEVSTVLTEVTSINKIEIRGNVELFVSDGATDEAKVYNNYYANGAMIKDNDGTLRITSYAAKKLVVWVKASDLRSITAYDNAVVGSFGKLSAIELDVKLFNNATAKLDVDVNTASIVLNDHSKAELAGSIEDANFKYDLSTTMNSKNLVAKHTSTTLNYDSDLELATL